MSSRLDRGLLCFSIAANVLCAGGVFTFPLLSPVLAERVKLTQPQLTSIVLAGMAGQYPCTPLVGKIVDSHGPWLCSLIASLLFSLAFGGFSYQVHQMLDTTSIQPSQISVYLLVLLFALAGFATVFAYFSSLFAATRSFPSYPGAASGTVMALFGLSPLFLSFLASTFFTDSADESFNLVQFLVFLTALTGVVHLIGALNLRAAPNNHLPATVPVQDDEANETTALLTDGSRKNWSGSSIDLVLDPYFWVFFVLLAVTLGPCEMIISNVGTIVLSLPSVDGSSGAAAFQVKTLAISNTVTRLLVGPIADFVAPILPLGPQSSLRKHYISRAVFLVGPAVILALTFLWMELFVQSQADIWLLSLGTGIAYGATFTVLPSIIASVWGVQNAGRNFGIVVFAPLMGTTIFSYLYAFISAHHSPSEGLCRGPSCWQTTFWISGGFQIVAILGAVILWRGWGGLL
ncbi:MFS general substrate transporter [Mycena alexandri]|uniref:Probable transporter MCH1 n=1 Tax=Mycena alexandri TaxID=1745969 RepID=A0AAD6TI36_9AGAR|nr:MFS general substrate transporter [Mycena alexandri]